MLLDRVFKSPTNEPWKKDWWSLLTIKLFLGLFIPFFSDEAYYWVWSQNLKLSYFDHPPMVAWLFRLGHLFEGVQFGSRIPFIILSHLTLWLWCHYLSNQINSREKRCLLWLLCLHPLVGLGGLVANPDIPFLFFWSLSLTFYLACLRNKDSWVLPALLGSALGLGFTSKYLMGLILIPIFIHLILSQEWKKLRWHHIVLPMTFGFLFSLPVWVWNYENEWASLRFQLEHGLGKAEWRPKWTLDFLIGTFVLLFPPFVFVFCKILKKSLKNFHFILTSSLLLFFTYTTLKGDTELNWPVMIYPSFLLLVVPHVISTWKELSYKILFGFLGMLLISISTFPSLKSFHPRLKEGQTYESLFRETQEYRPLYLHTYQIASYFSFLSKEPFYKLRGASRKDEFDLMPGSEPQESFFFYIKEPYQNFPEEQLVQYIFEKVKDLSSGFELYTAKRKP